MALTPSKRLRRLAAALYLAGLYLATLGLAALPAGAAERDPLIDAAARGDAQVVEELLGAGADIAVTDWGGWTPLAWAALGLHDAAVGLLIEAGADVNALARSGKNSGRPLMLAARRRGAHSTLAILLEAGARVNGTDQYGRTALMMAAREGLTGNMRLLMRAGANVHVRARLERGNTALVLARRGGHGEAEALLRAAGAIE